MRLDYDKRVEIQWITNYNVAYSRKNSAPLHIVKMYKTYEVYNKRGIYEIEYYQLGNNKVNVALSGAKGGLYNE